jgi:polyadenylate-binding protein
LAKDTAKQNVYIKEFRLDTTEEELKTLIEEHKFNVTGLTIAKDEAGKSRGFGFINFETPEQASNFIKLCESQVIKDKDNYPIYANLFETK